MYSNKIGKPGKVGIEPLSDPSMSGNWSAWATTQPGIRDDRPPFILCFYSMGLFEKEFEGDRRPFRLCNNIILLNPFLYIYEWMK